MAALVVTTIGVILSWSSYLAGIWLALSGWIILLGSCCCRTDRGGFITAGVLLDIAAAACFIQAVAFFGTSLLLAGVFSALATVVLVAASVLIFIFTCSGRLQAQLDATASQQDTEDENEPVTNPPEAVMESKPQNNNDGVINKDLEQGGEEEEIDDTPIMNHQDQ